MIRALAPLLSPRLLLFGVLVWLGVREAGDLPRDAPPHMMYERIRLGFDQLHRALGAKP